jgi:hypothetical protein
LGVKQAVPVRVTAPGYQDALAKQYVYFTPLFVTKEEVQTKNAHYLVISAMQILQILLNVVKMFFEYLA